MLNAYNRLARPNKRRSQKRIRFSSYIYPTDSILHWPKLLVHAIQAWQKVDRQGFI